MTARERVEAELNELRARMEKLKEFSESGKIKGLSWKAAALLQTQYYLMQAYAETLDARLAIWKD